MITLKNSLIATTILLMTQTNAEAQSKKDFCLSPVPKDKILNVTKASNNALKTLSTTQSTVNVVFHVVWKTPQENISDSIIFEQMKTLNEDFNKQNPDTGNLRALFKPIAGNANIHFNLHQIIRKQTNQTFYEDATTALSPNSFDMKIASEAHFDSTGGSNAVDPTHFLNIWVIGKLESKYTFTLGGIATTTYDTTKIINAYGYPPAGLSYLSPSYAPPIGEDGILSVYDLIWGSNNPKTIISDGSTLLVNGTVLVHEIGHYLGLRHIEGDADDCTGDDGIADTPKQNLSSDSCNVNANSCVDTSLPWISTDAPDMTENYMGHTPLDCRVAFTIGQTDFMNSVLLNERSGLIGGTTNLNGFNQKNTINLKVFPNPTKELLQIELFNELNNTELTLYNLLGEILLTKSVNVTKDVLNIGDLHTGVYFIEITNNKGQHYREKIIKE